MTIDTDGHLWIALFGGDGVIKIDSQKPETLLETIKLPAHQVRNKWQISYCFVFLIIFLGKFGSFWRKKA